MLAEFHGLLRKAGRENDYPSYVQSILGDPRYRFESIIASDLIRLHDLDDIPELHARLIGTVAVRLGATLVTRDR